MLVLDDGRTSWLYIFLISSFSHNCTYFEAEKPTYSWYNVNYSTTWFALIQIYLAPLIQTRMAVGHCPQTRICTRPRLSIFCAVRKHDQKKAKYPLNPRPVYEWRERETVESERQSQLWSYDSSVKSGAACSGIAFETGGRAIPTTISTKSWTASPSDFAEHHVGAGVIRWL